MHVLEGILLALAAASIALYLTLVTSFLVAMRGRNPARPPSAWPRVSILKPVAGLDDELEENLSSFAALEYPDYEILLGVASVEDCATPLARKFAERAGHDKVRLIVTDPDAAANPKVAQLISLERAATGEIIVISDSNVRVTPGYLDALVSELSLPGVGAVSNIVSGTGERTLGAALENLQLCAVIAPGIVASAAVMGRIITLGKSMAMWREALQRVGSFSRVAHVLSDDDILGRAFEHAGYEVRVSLWPVENRNVTCSFERTLERHTRWAKIRRVVAPTEFAIEPLLSPIAITTLAGLASPTKLIFCAYLLALVLQMTCAALTARALRGTPRWYWAPLEIARSYLLFLCWLRACVSRRVSWRGHAIELGRDSAIMSVQPGAARCARATARA